MSVRAVLYLIIAGVLFYIGLHVFQALDGVATRFTGHIQSDGDPSNWLLFTALMLAFLGLRRVFRSVRQRHIQRPVTF